VQRKHLRTGNCKYIDIMLPVSPAVLATNVSNADIPVVSVLQELVNTTEVVDLIVTDIRASINISIK